MPNDIKKLILKSSNPKLIESAFLFAKETYKNRKRISGENYIDQDLRLAVLLDNMGMDSTTVAFAILHNILDDVLDSVKEDQVEAISKKFGTEIGLLIKKSSDLSKIRNSLTQNENKNITKEKFENLRKMFLAIAGDLRVVLVELVSRLDGLNFLHLLPENKQKVFALETLQIFVPLARRLGLSEIRRKLEDISFSYLFPEKYKWIKDNITVQYEEREKYLKKTIPLLKKIFKKERIAVKEISYRAKSYWSTYKKLLSHNMDFNKVHDLLALRIITDDIPSCYKILGVLHKHFKPISGEINDYIAKPKPNSYRSLHTTVFLKDETVTEIQIRTEEMQKEAEYGICAHWSYKEKIDLSKDKEKLSFSQNVPEFWKNFKIDFFENQVFTFTPRGDIIVLPKNSTPVDFAYAVHSEIGNHCESAKIGGKIVQLNHILQNGDIVEITVNKNRKPSADWLRFVETSFAKSHIKKATEIVSGFQFPIPEFIKRKIAEISERAQKRKEEKAKIKKENPRQIFLGGQKGMLINLAKCCNPQPGDKVKAYLSKRRSAVLHRTSCSNFKKIAEKFPDKIIDASW
jgi:GTP diphosphokinase / guanosine-3',5'-bis(diphosphate) 3'-diphosphatase